MCCAPHCEGLSVLLSTEQELSIEFFKRLASDDYKQKIWICGNEYVRVWGSGGGRDCIKSTGQMDTNCISLI